MVRKSLFNKIPRFDKEKATARWLFLCPGFLVSRGFALLASVALS